MAERYATWNELFEQRAAAPGAAPVAAPPVAAPRAPPRAAAPGAAPVEAPPVAAPRAPPRAAAPPLIAGIPADHAANRLLAERRHIVEALAAANAAFQQAEELMPVPGPVPEYLNIKDEDINSKDLEEYKEMLKCPVCIENIKDIRLSPCGHMMCKLCVKGYVSRGEIQCPVCRKLFTSFDKVYYGKYLKYKMKYLQLLPLSA